MENKLTIYTLQECCQFYQVEEDFLHSLHERGLLQFVEEDNAITDDDLVLVERYKNFYYNMDINMEGIEAIAHLLEKIEMMRQQMRTMQNRLSQFE